MPQQYPPLEVGDRIVFTESDRDLQNWNFFNEEAFLERFTLGRYYQSNYSKHRLVVLLFSLLVFTGCLYFIIIGYNYSQEPERVTARENLMLAIGGSGILHTLFLCVELF